jgi:excisionase family DNA binding protein
LPDLELTLHEVAELLGVHYMTAYRYVRLGLLPAEKVGAGWVVRRGDLDAFRSAGPTRARGRASKGEGRWAARFEARLLAGDQRGAWSVLESALAAGTDLDELYLEVVVPSLRSIGERWAHGEIDVAVEHRASGIVTKLLGRLSARMVRRGRSRGTVVIGAAPGERHGLPVTIVADLVRAQGFQVDDLGPDVPAASFAAAAADADRLVAVGISVTTPGLEDSVRGAVQAVRDALGPVPVLIGGSAIADEQSALRLGADCWAADATGAMEAIEGLVPSRRRA